jgi:hypothetical protein
MPDLFQLSRRSGHCLLTRRVKRDAKGVVGQRSNGVLRNQHSNTPFFLSVNAKQLEQPVFQAGPNRCKSDHGCHLSA